MALCVLLSAFYRPVCASPRLSSYACALLPDQPHVALEACAVHGRTAPSASETSTASGPPARTLVLAVSNPSSQIQQRVLDLGVPDVLTLTVRSADGTTALAQDRSSTYDSRPIHTPRLAVALAIPPGDSEVHLRYSLHADGLLTPTLYSESALHQARTRDDLLNGAILGVMLTLALVSAAYSLIGRHRAYGLYAPLVLTEVMMLLQIEGYAFALLWPHAPGWNNVAPLVIATLVVILHAGFAIDFLQLRARHPTLLRLHLALGIALALNLVQMPGLWFELGMIALAALYCALALATAVMALRTRSPGAPLYALGTASLFLFGIVLFVLGILGHNPIPVISFFNYPKFGLLFEAVCFSAAMINRIRLIQSQQAELRMRRVAEAQELLQAEHARREADARARETSLQLASASHDISQPLASLRFAAEALRRQTGMEAMAAHLDNTLSHAQSLLHTLMDRSRTDVGQLSDTVHLGALLAQWQTDFEPLAHARRVVLRAAHSHQVINGSGLVLTRIAHNLLANAIRHSGRGARVLVGVRQRANGLELQVLDNGPGLTPAQVSTLQQPFVQGDHPAGGHGLGLHIVRTLCDQAGYRLLVRSWPGKGSCFAVHIPLPAHS